MIVSVTRMLIAELYLIYFSFAEADGREQKQEQGIVNLPVALWLRALSYVYLPPYL